MYNLTAISLQPEQFVYNVNEFDPSVTVCAQLAGNFEQSLTIDVTTQPSQVPPIASKLIFCLYNILLPVVLLILLPIIIDK